MDDLATKRCCTCHRVQPVDEFNRQRAAPDGRQDRCRDCCRAWYQANKRTHRANVAKNNAARTIVYHQRICAYLLEHPCVDCGEGDIRCLDFDHVTGPKQAAVADLVGQLVSWQRIEAEIAKCEVRCANCHRRVTGERGGYYREAAWQLTAVERQGAARARLEAVLTR